MLNFNYKKITSLLLSVASFAFVVFFSTETTFAEGPGVVSRIAGFAGSTIIDAVITLFIWTVVQAFAALTIVLWFATHVLDLAIKIAIIDFPIYANLDGIRIAWEVGRDLANFFFIFVLLYSAISTILGIEKSSLSKNLTKIIMVAIFINFSLPITRVIIDVTNVFAVEFYNKTFDTTLGQGPTELFLTTLDPVTRMAVPDPKTGEITLSQTSANFKALFIQTVLACIFMLVAIHVILAAALLLVMRVVVLCFLLALSSFAFFSLIIPKTAKYYDEWWGWLVNNTVFAPAYMFMLYFTFQVALKTNLKAKIAVPASSSDLVNGLNLGETLATTVYFILLIGFMGGGLYVAKALGAYGADTAKGLAGKARDNLVKGSLSGVRSARKYADDLSGGRISGARARIAGGLIGTAKAIPLINRLPMNQKEYEEFSARNPGISGALNSLGSGARGLAGNVPGLENLGDFQGALSGDAKADAAGLKPLIDGAKSDPYRMAEIFENITDDKVRQELYNGLSDREKIALENSVDTRLERLNGTINSTTATAEQKAKARQEHDELKAVEADRKKKIKEMTAPLRAKYSLTPEQEDKLKAEQKKVDEAKKKKANKDTVKNILTSIKADPNKPFTADEVRALKSIPSKEIAGILEPGDEPNADDPRTNPRILGELTAAQMRQLVLDGELGNNTTAQAAIRSFIQSRGINDPVGRIIKDETMKSLLGI